MIGSRRAGPLARVPRAKDAVHASIEKAIGTLARIGLDLDRRRLEIDELAARGVRLRFEELQGPERVSVREPSVRADEKPGRFAQLVEEAKAGYSTSRAGILELSDAKFHLPSGVVAVNGFYPAETLLQRYWPHSYQLPGVLRLAVSRGKPVPDGCLLALSHWWNYYHWVCEILPLALALAARDADCRFYVPRDLPRFASEYLRLLDLDGSCTPLETGVYRAATLRVPTVPGYRLNRPSPLNVHRVRAALRATAAAEGSPPRRRIYVSRGDTVFRRVLNERELVDALSGVGFEAVTLGRLAVRDQLRLFSEAEIVVGPHGAGMANLITAPERCRVVELMGDVGNVNPPFLVLSSILGLEYAYVRCEDVHVHLRAPVDAVLSVVRALGVS